jgi:hypothetical protein
MTEVRQANDSSMRHSAGENTATKERLNDWFRFTGAFQKMTAIPKALARIATTPWNLEDHDDSRARASEVAMAKVIEFYIPQNFRTTKWVPDVHRGKILELRSQTKKAASLAFSGHDGSKKSCIVEALEKE